MDFFTQVKCGILPVSILTEEQTMVLGSCFADSIGARMKDAGFNVMVNPFGTLYNPFSISSAIERLESGIPFTADDCVRMGAGSGLICSFAHHSSFAREDETAFLDNANRLLAEASEFWHRCTKVILSFGTARVWRRADNGLIVSNCLKRPADEFLHELRSLESTVAAIEASVSSGKGFILTVSPIRYLGDGAHDNTISKATLQLATESVVNRHPDRICYFPAYEILLDELRDYRFYAEDMKHPSATAINLIWERFLSSAVPQTEIPDILAMEKAARRSRHRPLHVKD